MPRRKKQAPQAERILVTVQNKGTNCDDIRALYGIVMRQAEEAGWKDYKFINVPKGRSVLIERTK